MNIIEKNRIKEVIQDIRDLRDADTHVCPNVKNNDLECSCDLYDQVTDKLNLLIGE